MKKTLFILIIVILTVVTDCNAFSIPESIARGQRPESLKKYKNGPISPLSQKDIEEAIEFGKANKHRPDVIKYAYIFEKDISSFLGATRHVYILVCTNYFLIAEYAANQSKNYDSIDMDYVNFLANLPTFHIELIEQISYALQTTQKFVLLKNGEKVKEAENYPLYKNFNPYATSYLYSIQSTWQAIADETVKKTMDMANQITEYNQKAMKMDIPPSGFGKPENIYSYKDIDLNSKYEIVVLYNDGEKHIAINLSKVK